MPHNSLFDFVEATATEFGIPGVAVGVWADDQETSACHGITSVDNPLPVDTDTLYVLGSVTKTYTATALMRLVTNTESTWMHQCIAIFRNSSLQTRMLRLASPVCSCPTPPRDWAGTF